MMLEDYNKDIQGKNKLNKAKIKTKRPSKKRQNRVNKKRQKSILGNLNKYLAKSQHKNLQYKIPLNQK